MDRPDSIRAAATGSVPAVAPAADKSVRRWRADAAHTVQPAPGVSGDTAAGPQLRARLLQMILENEQVRRNEKRTNQR